MTPREFLEAVVRPNVDAFHDDISSVRHAFNAINAVDALVSHLYVWASSNAPKVIAGTKHDSAYRNRLATSNQQFGLLRDIAKAQKHVRLTQGNPTIGHFDQLSSCPITYDGRARHDGEFTYGPQMVVESNGTIASVKGIVDDALNFLEAELSSSGA